MWDWSTLALAGFSLIGLLGLIDALTCSIELLPDRMKVVQNFRKREYAKLEVVDVAWAKGVGVKLRLSNGRFEELPEVGDGSSSLAAHIRNWLRGNADAV